MVFRQWITPGELMKRWRCWPFQIGEAWRAGLPVYSSINGAKVEPGESCLECTLGNQNGGKGCDHELCAHVWTYEGFCPATGEGEADYYRLDVGGIGDRLANGAFTFDLDEVEASEREHGLTSQEEADASVPALAGLDPEERRELGQLRRDQEKWDLSISASIAVGKALTTGGRFTKEDVWKVIVDAGIDRNDLPNTTFKRIWDRVPEGFRKGRGRPKGTGNPDS